MTLLQLSADVKLGKIKSKEEHSKHANTLEAQEYIHACASTKTYCETQAVISIFEFFWLHVHTELHYGYYTYYQSWTTQLYGLSFTNSLGYFKVRK